jgi:superfamily II DNA helicase RecQ
VKLENLYRSVSFCDNSVECRRVLLLEYFGQSFDRKECNGTCDNCAALASGMIEAKERDCSQEVRSILNLTRYLCGNGKTFTVCQLAAFWRGDAKVSPGVNRVAQKCEAYGGGSSFSKSEAERIVQQMVLRFVLDEENVVVGREGFTASYVREGVRARDFDASTPPEFLVTYTTKKKAAQKPKPPVVEDAERRKAKDKGKGRSSKPQVHDITGGDASSSKSPGHSLPHSGRKRARDSLASEENNVGTDCSKHFSSKTVDEEQDEELEGCTYQDRIDRKLQVKLKEKMVDLRKTIGDEQRTNYYNYCSNAVIKNISRLVPLSIRDLRICGMGAYKVTVHGQRFLDVTRAFVEQHSLLLSPILNDPIPSASVENLPQTMVENELQICAMDEEPEGYWMSNVYDTQDFSTSQSP